MAELTYIRVGDYYIPNLVLDEPKPVKTVGKYGSLRRTYLKQHNHCFRIQSDKSSFPNIQTNSCWGSTFNKKLGRSKDDRIPFTFYRCLPVLQTSKKE